MVRRLLAALLPLLAGCTGESPCDEIARLQLEVQLVRAEAAEARSGNACQFLSDTAARDCYQAEREARQLRSAADAELIAQNQRRIAALRHSSPGCS